MKRTVRRIVVVFAALAVAGIGYAAEPAANCQATTARMAITVDDLPFEDRSLSFAQQKAYTEALLKSLKSRGVPAIGFVNEDKLLVNGEVDERIGLLREWLDAGMSLGNHGFGHLSLQKMPLSMAEAAVLKGDVIIRWLMQQYGMVPRYYRYPYNQTGPDFQVRSEFVAFLNQNGYIVAPFTIENDDFVYDKVYNYDLQHGNKHEAIRVKGAYLAQLPIVMQVHEKMTQELFGHPIVQIFDLHANSINSDSFDALLDALKHRGYCFVSLATALEDPAYDSPDGYAGPYGMSWLRRWAIARGKEKFSVYPPDPPDWVTKRYETVSKEIGGG